MAKTYLDECFDKTIPNRIRNIRIYMVFNNLDQNDIALSTGYVKSTVSKNISFNGSLSDGFAEKFCSTFNIPLQYLNYDNIKFYNTISKEKRERIKEETGDDPGDLRDIEFLNSIGYKFEEEDIPKIVKKDEISNVNEVKNIILYDKKMLYKNAFSKIPAIIAIVIGIAAVIITTITITNANIAYSLFLLILFPISFILINHYRKNTFSTPISKYYNTYYELDKEYLNKTFILVQVIEILISTIFCMYVYIAFIFAAINDRPDTLIALITLFVTEFSAISSMVLLKPSIGPFPQRLTKKYMKADMLRGLSFYTHILILFIFISFYFKKWIPLAFMVIEGIVALISLGVYIFSKYRLSKYKLYRYYLEEKQEFYPENANF